MPFTSEEAVLRACALVCALRPDVLEVLGGRMCVGVGQVAKEDGALGGARWATNYCPGSRGNHGCA